MSICFSKSHNWHHAWKEWLGYNHSIEYNTMVLIYPGLICTTFLLYADVQDCIEVLDTAKHSNIVICVSLRLPKKDKNNRECVEKQPSQLQMHCFQVAEGTERPNWCQLASCDHRSYWKRNMFCAATFPQANVHISCAGFLNLCKAAMYV